MAASSFDGVSVDAHAALAGSGHAFTISDARLPDFPLTWVNHAFEQLTGYDAADVVGRNCRFLTGPDTDRAAASRLRVALETGVPVTETLLNYRPDGSSWWNRVHITPVFGSGGELTHFVGVQADVGESVVAHRELDEARAAISESQRQRYASEHAVALALQRSLLPVLPDVAGLSLAARYLPASDAAEVGGDWYDVLPLPDGGTGLAVGDVMGHDLHAAASMGQLRSVLRSYAWEGYGPAEVLDRLDQLVCGLGMAQLATCVYARLDGGADGRPAVLTWSNAGHPPPMLRTPDGVVQLLDDASSLLIGVTSGTTPAMHERGQGRRELAPGSTLLLYTDGLIEDRARDIDESIEQLRGVFAGADTRLSVDGLADHVVAGCGYTGHEDDRCLLVVRLDRAVTR